MTVIEKTEIENGDSSEAVRRREILQAVADVREALQAENKAALDAQKRLHELVAEGIVYISPWM